MATSAKKIVLKPAPLQSKSGQFQGQIIVLPSSFIQQVDPGSSNSIRISNGSTLKISKPAASSIVVPAQAAGSKRPMVYDSGSGASAGQPARKRANLDHMSPEEKLMRRKLKNRVAAQNARDKKRLRMDEIEVKLQELEEANAKLQMENESLRALNERLMSSQRSTTTTPDYPNTTFSSSSMTPPHSDYYSDSASSCGSSSSCDRAASPTGSVLSSSSSASSADCSLVDSRSFDSAEESGSRVGRIVDGGDGDNGAGGFLPGGSEHDRGNLPDISDIEKFLSLAGSGPVGQAGAAEYVAPKEETTVPDNDGQDAAVKTEPMLDFDDCFSELFPDLSMADAGIINL